MRQNSMINPFDAATDLDRHFIWQRIVAVDCDAFVLTDWSMIEPDFDADAFEGIRCFASQNPDDWHLSEDRKLNRNHGTSETQVGRAIAFWMHFDDLLIKRQVMTR